MDGTAELYDFAHSSAPNNSGIIVRPCKTFLRDLFVFVGGVDAVKSIQGLGKQSKAECDKSGLWIHHQNFLKL